MEEETEDNFDYCWEHSLEQSQSATPAKPIPGERLDLAINVGDCLYDHIFKVLTPRLMVTTGLPCILFIYGLDNSIHYRQHHGGRGRVGYPHGQKPRDEHHSQHQPVTSYT